VNVSGVLGGGSLAAVVADAHVVSVRGGGGGDVVVASVVNLWGYGYER
jgi:hypothetical protein